MAIRRWISTIWPVGESDEAIFYVRTPSREEIDFTSKFLAGAAVEGKYTENGSWRGEATNVEASELDGILVTRNVLDTGTSSTWAIPAGILCYLLDT